VIVANDHSSSRKELMKPWVGERLWRIAFLRAIHISSPNKLIIGNAASMVSYGSRIGAVPRAQPAD
jgi:hypothetical protein